MESTSVENRDAALRLLNRLTFGFAAAALAGVGFFSVVSAATIPGTSSSASSQSTTSSTSSSSTASSTLQPTSGSVSSAPSGSGTVATGASR